MGTTLFPSIDAACAELHSFVCVESAGDHLEKTLLDSIENFVGVVNGADADVGACWMLHGREERETGSVGYTYGVTLDYLDTT